MCSRHEQLPRVIGTGPQWATTNVRQKATVVCDIRGSGRGNAGRFQPPADKMPTERVSVHFLSLTKQ